MGLPRIQVLSLWRWGLLEHPYLEQRESRRAQGLCMDCGKKGHYVRECPERLKKRNFHFPSKKVAVMVECNPKMEESISPALSRENPRLQELQLPSLDIREHTSSVSHIVLSMLLTSHAVSHHVLVMVDSGATGNFIGQGVVKRLGLQSIPREKPERVLTVDGTPLKSGLLAERMEVLELLLKGDPWDHEEEITLNITEAP